MNLIRIACSLVLCSLLTAVTVQRVHASVLTQDEPKAHQPSPEMQQPEPKPETPEAKPEQQPEKQENAKPEQQQRNETKEQATQDQTKDLTKEQKKEQKEQKKQHKDQRKVNNNEERTNAAAGNANGQSAKMQGKGGHIPDDKFRANFGRNHTFVVNRPVIVNNQPTFQYGGYSFIIADPWPVGWAYTDDCYIDYVDGEYFLFDLLHPGVRIEVFVGA